MIKYFNRFASGEHETFHALATESSLAMFFNCKAGSARDALEQQVPRDEVRFSASQNLMDNLGIPHQQVIDPTLLFEEHEEALNLFMPGLRFRFVREPEILE